MVINFHCIYSILKIFICCVPAQILWEKSCSWDIGQNPLSQSDCRISPEQIDETVVFNMLIWPIWSLDSKIELTNGIKNGCDQSCYWTLKLTVSEEWTDGINWFFACWYRFTKIKSWSKIYWVGMVKNGCGYSGHGTLKMTVFQKE